MCVKKGEREREAMKKRHKFLRMKEVENEIALFQ